MKTLHKVRGGPPMLQHPVEFEELLALYIERQPQRVLEVGVGEGGTLYHWLQQAPPGAVVVALDDRHQNRALYPAWVPAAVELVTVSGDSHDPAVVDRVAAHGPFGWVFIDADHHEADVRLDWLSYGAMVVEGAIVFHDIRPTDDPSIEVDRLWTELRASHQTVEIVHHNGQGIGVVLLENGPILRGRAAA